MVLEVKDSDLQVCWTAQICKWVLEVRDSDLRVRDSDMRRLNMVFVWTACDGQRRDDWLRYGDDVLCQKREGVKEDQNGRENGSDEDINVKV